jgi:PPOX class probable F420-dependent enzyme
MTTTSQTRAGRAPAHGYVLTVTILSGAVMGIGGAWSLLAPESFSDFVAFGPANIHFLHDLGAFQLGLAVTLLLAVLWRDALALALAGFLLGNSLHALNHALDLHLGGRGAIDWLGLALLSVLVAIALAFRLRDLGYVVGRVSPASTAALVPFVEQKTVALTTYRRDGSPVTVPVSMAVDGDRAFIRTPERAGKVTRLRANPLVTVAPSDARGRLQGPAIQARARVLDGEEWRHAGRRLRAKHPLLHGVLVPAVHHLFRTRTGRTMHYELTPE